MKFRDAKVILEKAGWVDVRQCGSHHQFKHPGNPNVVTLPEHKSKDIASGTLANVRRTTGLSQLR